MIPKLKAKPAGPVRTTVTQGFSITPQQKRRVAQLAKHYDTNMSKVVAGLIDAAHEEALPPKKRSKKSA